MRVLTIYAHANPHSFCHALLERFTAGLADAGHESEVVDLHAIGFDPVFGLEDYLAVAGAGVPDEVREALRPAEAVCPIGDPPRDRDMHDIVRRFAARRPNDVLAQQEKVARADALAFIAPVYAMGFPAILKGWLDRVLTGGFADALARAGRDGAMWDGGPSRTEKQAIILSTTFFSETDYRQGCAAARRALIDEGAFAYPGIRTVEHVYCYAPHAVGEEQRQEYLRTAYRTGQEFAERTAPGASVAA